MCYAMLAPHADDRFYYLEEPDTTLRSTEGTSLRSTSVKLGDLATRVDVEGVRRFGLADGWQQLDIGITFSEPARLWTFPLETVSQSEAGFEAVYQGSVVLTHWTVVLERGESWKLKLEESHQ